MSADALVVSPMQLLCVRNYTISFVTSHIPSQWKLHCIHPIHKSGVKSLVSNYRPIFLLSCVSKVLEGLIYNNAIDFVFYKPIWFPPWQIYTTAATSVSL